MDLVKAFDRVDSETMWNWKRLNGSLLSTVQNFHIGSQTCVRVGSKVSHWFPMKLGLRQG